MNVKDLQLEARKAWKAKPHMYDDIQDIVSMALDEIADGGSEAHECELALDEIKEICK